MKEKQKRREAIFVLLLTLAWNQTVYNGARCIAGGWHHYDMTSALDLQVPFLPWTVTIYFGCYLLWALNYLLCALQSETERDRFFCADMIAKGICLVFFLLVPTTNVRPEVTGDGIWDILMRLLYQIDAADNLFPSIHCLVSWFCWIGVRKRKDIPAWYRWFSLGAAIAVCLVTLTTKQHVIADVIGGVVLAEISYFLAGFAKIRGIYAGILARLLKLFRLDRNRDESGARNNL